ncbi:MAG TPA: sigma factor-like helix-turn-helix DNA-binding protein [Flavobacterium sp.]|nr:sigma factor-like helix-turn-helix DNA-binding protein [Flavobacterium sp.]
MISIITGDIVNSRKLDSTIWIDGLKKILDSKGKNPGGWEIYRGDQFQLEIKNPEAALLAALQIKAYLKTLKLDARMSIGFGDKTYTADKISESNGSAFIHSGEVFETLKKQKVTLAVNSGNTVFDREMNLMLRLGLTFMDNWLPQSAEFILVAIANQSLSQEEIGNRLGINQAAVSRRQKRARFDLMMELCGYFTEKIKTLNA